MGERAPGVPTGGIDLRRVQLRLLVGSARDWRVASTQPRAVHGADYDFHLIRMELCGSTLGPFANMSAAA